MTTTSLFIAFTLMQASALLLAFVIAVQLVRGKRAETRGTWLRWVLAPPAFYVFSFLPLSAGFVLMTRNASLSAGAIGDELRAMVSDPTLLWPAAVILLLYALVVAVASFRGERRLQTGRG